MNVNVRHRFLISIALGMVSLPLAASEPNEGVDADRTTLPADGLLKRLAGAAEHANDPLPPEQAFAVAVVAKDAATLTATFTPVPGYYLYRDKFTFRVQHPPGIEIAGVTLPRGKMKDDPFFGKSEIFDQAVQATVKLDRRRNRSAATLSLHVKYQGCNIPLGVCYLPIEKTLDVAVPAP